MKVQLFTIALLFTLLACQPLSKVSEQPSNGSIALFNGKNLDMWRGSSNIWSVQDGCIVGRTTDENKIEKNTFLIYEKPFSDFELTFQYKIIGGNSGVQYRAKVLDEEAFIVGGYQADMEAGINHSGILYEEKGRGILAKRGQEVTIGEDGEMQVTEFAKSEDIQAKIKQEQWNSYRVVANGEHLQHFINENKTIDVIDKQPGKRASSGIIALQVHAGPDMVVYYKDIMIKRL
jgi:hypothetical protein